MILVAACRSGPTGYSRSQAVAAAREQFSQFGRLDSIISVRIGPERVFDEGSTEPERRVWAVAATGSFRFGSCGPPPPAGQPPKCADPATSALILLDYFDGTFVEGGFPAEAPK